MNSDRRTTLEQPLAAAMPDGFFDKNWETATHLAPGAIAEVSTDILTVEIFEALMASAPAGAVAGLSVIDNGLACPVAGDSTAARLPAVYDAYRRGCTLLQSGLQLRWPPIARICRDVENLLISRGIPLAEPVAANAYLTPANSHGFDIHYDNHCALILQLHGAKRWTVFPPVDVLPLDRCEKPMASEDLGNPVLDATLDAGDVLYLPRGFPHCAVACDDTSLHLTLSLRALTWVDTMAALCRADASLRRSVRIATGDPAPAQHYFESELCPRVRAMSIGAFLERRLAECVAGLNPIPSGHIRAIDRTPAVTADTRLRRRPHVMCAVTEEDSEAVLRFPGATLRLPSVMTRVFEFIAGHEEFTARDLPAVDAVYDRVELTRILVKRGLVEGA